MPNALRESDVELIDHLGFIDPETHEGTVDFDPTLSSWGGVRDILDDMEFATKVMAAAYDGALYSLQRHRREDKAAKDLPIGAAIGSKKHGLFVPSFAQDKELDDPYAHAEVMAMRNLEEILADSEIFKNLGELTLGVTLEPCPSCLDQIQSSNLPITRVIYGSNRLKLEERSILRHHKEKAPEIITSGRVKGDYLFEFFQFPNATVQAACVEVFAAFLRDLEDEKVKFDPNFSHATRYAHFLEGVNESRKPETPTYDEDGNLIVTVPKRSIDKESDALLKYFFQVMEGFQGSRRVASQQF